MATRLNRAACARAVLDLHREHDLITSTTTVKASIPGDTTTDEAIFVLTIEGQPEWPVMQAGGVRQFDDMFDITIEYRTTGFGEETAAIDRTEELLNVGIEALNTAASTLNSLDGVVSAEVTELNGPLVREMRHGFVGFGQGVVSVHSRIVP